MANLLEEASILLTPTAYDNGRMLAVKPEIALGDELIVNGDFVTDSDWTKGSGWSITNGVASHTGGASYLIQSVLQADKLYKVEISVTEVSGGFVQIYMGNSPASVLISAIGDYTYYFTSQSTVTLGFALRSLGNISIDNVSVKEDLSGDFTFSRNSAATRVNAQGLVENVQILSSDLVSNGDFSQEGVQEVSNGSFSQEGSELVTNGNFATDTDWTKGTGWTISEGAANCDGLQAYQLLRQATTNGVVGKTFLVKYDVTNNSGVGGIKVKFGGVDLSGYDANNGSFEFYVEATSTDYIRFTPQLDFNGSIDNVSVKEVGQSWAKDANWSIADGKAVSTGAGRMFQSIPFLEVNVGTRVAVSFDIVDYTSGGVVIQCYGGLSENFTGAGTHTFTTVTTNTLNLYINNSGQGNLVGSITNISVKEVGQDWTLGTGWNIGEDKATIDNTVNTGLDQSILVTGKKYKVSFEISDLQVGGNVTIGDVVTPSSYIATSNGSQSFIHTATYSTLRVRGKGYPCSITNISVKEITDDTNLPRINYEGFSYQDSLGSEEIVNGDFATDTDWGTASNWTISGGSANADGSSSGLLAQSTTPTVPGKTYKLEYTILNYVSGSIRFNYGGTGESFHTSNGTYVSYRVATNTNSTFASSSINFIGSIDNVSVKEVLGQEVVPDSGCGSWLLEPQSTNSIQSSNTVTAMAYTRGLTRSDNAAISPNGELNAMSFVPTITNETHRSSYSTGGGTYNQGDIVTFSGFVKPNGYDFVTMGGFFGSEDAVFNISNGTLVSQDSNVIDTKIVKLTNGWYRLSTTYTFQNHIGNGLLYAGIYVLNTETGYGFAGDGVSGVYGYGFQAELGTGTSYIPTSGAASTRLQDVANNSGNASLINSEEGVLYAEISAISNNQTNRDIAISDGTLQNRSFIFYNINNNGLSAQVKVNNNAVFSVTTTLLDITSFSKVALKYKTNNFALWVDGVEIFSQLSGITYSVDTLDRLDFAVGITSAPFYGKTKAIAVYKTALTDEQLTALTTI